MAESEEELKSLLMKVKVESEKVGYVSALNWIAFVHPLLESHMFNGCGLDVVFLR